MYRWYVLYFAPAESLESASREDRNSPSCSQHNTSYMEIHDRPPCMLTDVLPYWALELIVGLLPVQALPAFRATARASRAAVNALVSRSQVRLIFQSTFNPFRFSLMMLGWLLNEGASMLPPLLAALQQPG